MNNLTSLTSLTLQCADVVNVIHNFSSLVQCSGKRVSSFPTTFQICYLQTDHTGVIYSRSALDSFEIPQADAPIDRIWPHRPCRYRLFEQIEKLKDDCEQPEEPGKHHNYPYPPNPCDERSIFAIDSFYQKFYVFDLNQQYVGDICASQNNRIIIDKCIFVKNKIFVLYAVYIKNQQEWSDLNQNTIKWEVHIYDYRGYYLGLFCHGPREHMSFSSDPSLSADLHGNVFVSNSYSNKVYKFSPHGVLISEIDILNPIGIVVSSDDELFVISNLHCIKVYNNSNCQLKRSFDIVDRAFCIALLPNGKIVVGGQDHLTIYE